MRRPEGAAVAEPAVSLPTVRQDRRVIRDAARTARRAEADELRRFAMARRRRRVLAAVVVGAVVLVLGLPLALAVSPAFAVRHIAVVGADASVSAAVRRQLYGVAGTPLALVDRAAVGTDVARVAQVQSYAVEPLPPDTLRIRIVQRTPVGVVESGSSWHLVDAAGVVLASVGSRPAGRAQILVAGGTEGASFAAAAAVLGELPADLRARVDTVTATGPDALRLRLQHGPTVLWGDDDDAAAKSAALRAALLHAAKSASFVDVSSPGLVSIR